VLVSNIAKKISEKISPIPILILHMKSISPIPGPIFSTSIADTITNTAILTTAIEAEKRWKEKEVGKRIEVGCLLERMFWVGLISCRR